MRSVLAISNPLGHRDVMQGREKDGYMIVLSLSASYNYDYF